MASPPHDKHTLGPRGTKIFVIIALVLAIGFGALIVWTLYYAANDPAIQEEVERIREGLESETDSTEVLSAPVDTSATPG